jgi:hypothetical protein
LGNLVHKSIPGVDPIKTPFWSKNFEQNYFLYLAYHKTEDQYLFGNDGYKRSFNNIYKLVIGPVKVFS